MNAASILNRVLGPVMRGPSSAHTAGAYHIASMARDLLGQRPYRARFRFGPMGDLVQGMAEIPCHTRNALAASSAFVCADLILGGYQNPIPLDETIDAVYSVGKRLPSELRCAAKGGLALAPSAFRFCNRSCGKDEKPRHIR